MSTLIGWRQRLDTVALAGASIALVVVAVGAVGALGDDYGDYPANARLRLLSFTGTASTTLAALVVAAALALVIGRTTGDAPPTGLLQAAPLLVMAAATIVGALAVGNAVNIVTWSLPHRTWASYLATITDYLSIVVLAGLAHWLSGVDPAVREIEPRV
jgi:hypothetical protein